jgi:predicted secreted acid phosphatase
VSRRVLLLALALGALLAAPAVAGTTRTSYTPAQIRAYHDSGAWGRSVGRVYRSAERSLRRQLDRRGAPRRPAVVLDIDETSLSNYPCLDAVDFELSGVATCVTQGRSADIPAARRFVAAAQKRHVTVFFITAAPEGLEASRRANLRKVGYRGRFTVIGRPASDTASSVVPYKSGERRKIERRGYRILVNVGDQRSDLAGGHARARFKLPNRIYVTT